MSDDLENPRDSQTAAPVALDYATPRAPDDVPAFEPVAEAALDRDASLREVARPFAKTLVAGKYIARAVARRHGPASAGDACGGCGATTTDAIVVRWSFVVPKRRPLLESKRVRGYADTHHAWCEPCRAPLWLRARRLSLANKLGGSLLIFGIVVCVAGLFLADPGPARARPTRVAIALVVVGLCISSGVEWYGKARVPGSIRGAVPRWLRFDRYAGVHRRERPR